MQWAANEARSALKGTRDCIAHGRSSAKFAKPARYACDLCPTFAYLLEDAMQSRQTANKPATAVPAAKI